MNRMMQTNILINTLAAAAVMLLMSACSTVRDTTDWIPGVDSNEEIKVEQEKEALEAKQKEREVYQDKAAFASTARTASDSDAKISVSIGQKYTQTDAIKRDDVGIEVNAGVVTLTGHVNSDDSAVRAISIAKSTVGVSRVISRLVVVNVRVPVEERE